MDSEGRQFASCTAAVETLGHFRALPGDSRNDRRELADAGSADAARLGALACGYGVGDGIGRDGVHRSGLGEEQRGEG